MLSLEQHMLFKEHSFECQKARFITNSCGSTVVVSDFKQLRHLCLL